jgi:hypothetical protein
MYDELLGRTYAEIGADAHSNHKCQGTSGLPALPGFATGRGGGGGGRQYALQDSTIPGQMQKDEASLFDDVDVTLAGVAKFTGANPPEALTTGLAAVVDQAVRAKKAFDAGDDAERYADRSRSDCAARVAGATGLDAPDGCGATRSTSVWRSRTRLPGCRAGRARLTFDAAADDGLVVAAQPVSLSLLA